MLAVRGQTVRSWFVPVALAAVTAVVAVHSDVTDWLVFRVGGATLLSSHGLHVYVLHPETQIGPLALLAGAPARSALYLQLVSAALVAPTLWLVARATAMTERQTVIGAAFLLLPWIQLAGWAHLDDAMALCFLAAVMADRSWRAGLWFAFAVASKPVAVFALLLLPSIAAAVVAAGVLLILSAPFVIAAHGSLALMHARNVERVSLPHMVFGAHGEPPAWIRPVQLLASVALGLAAGRRNWWRMLFIASAVRFVFEPAIWPYYVSWLAVGAVTFDAVERRRVLPWFAVGMVVVTRFPANLPWWPFAIAGLALAMLPTSVTPRRVQPA